jgi:lactate dehydrogenase-like 2-hydroxyacid dehydrogenase
MKVCILQNGRLSPAFETALAAEYDLCPLWQVADPGAFMAQQGEKFVGLVTSAPVGATAALINALSSLQVICSRGVGYEKIDLIVAKSRGVMVSNTPTVLIDCVADLAFGAVLSVGRGICAADRFVRRGDWQHQKFPLTVRVSGKKLGIVGMGGVGRAIARRAAGFDMEVRYNSRRRVPEVSHEFEESLTKLAHWADFLVVSAPGGPETRHLISAEVIAALGTKGYLVNISRGTLVDEQALVQALTAGKVAGAALDVFENEPSVPEALLAMENVVLLPHIASSTMETFAAMETLVLKNLRNFFKTGRLLTPII